MEPWFAEAKRIATLDADICFPLQDSFSVGGDSRGEPLPSPDIPRRLPSMVRSAEAVGHEAALADYYRAVIRFAREYRKPFYDIRHYFWLRFWLWNSDENVHIAFPWYDTYAVIDRFLTDASTEFDGIIFSDQDQSWELEMHRLSGEAFVRLRDPDDDETPAVTIRFPHDVLLAQIGPLRDRTESTIRYLSSAIGKDLWTRYVSWDDLCQPQPPDGRRRRMGWNLWRGKRGD